MVVAVLGTVTEFADVHWDGRLVQGGRVTMGTVFPHRVCARTDDRMDISHVLLLI